MVDNTTSVTEASETVKIPEEPSISGYILYKLDRTIAVVGLIIIAAWICWLKLPEGMQIVNTAVGGLIGYICGRNTK